MKPLRSKTSPTESEAPARPTLLPLKMEHVPPAHLKESSRNARTHSKKQIRQVADSIREFGWSVPIIADEDGVVIAGHARLEAAKLIGLRRVPVVTVAGLSETKKRALALADNKIAANAGWDRTKLAIEFQELGELLPEFNLDLGITGFEPAEIDAMLADLIDPEHDPADELPAASAALVSVRGDLWVCGKHRLLCGDATSAEAFRKLMGQERAAIVFTDPPYNVKIRDVQGRGKIKHREFAQASGELSSEAFIKFLRDSLGLAARYSIGGSIHFVCMDWRHAGDLQAAGRDVYTELKNLIVWVKTNAGQGTFYRSQHELIFAFKNGADPHINNFELGQHGRSRSNVWTYAGVNSFRAGRMDDLALHPTVKPVALVADALRDCSRRGDIVLDPFMGSGTTMLAAERIGRRAFGLDIDPTYVDAAIRRWQTFTGRDAIHERTGQTFDAVAAMRRSTNKMQRRRS